MRRLPTAAAVAHADDENREEEEGRDHPKSPPAIIPKPTTVLLVVFATAVVVVAGVILRGANEPLVMGAVVHDVVELVSADNGLFVWIIPVMARSRIPDESIDVAVASVGIPVVVAIIPGFVSTAVPHIHPGLGYPHAASGAR